MKNKIKEFLKDYHKFEGRWYKWSPIFHGESILPDFDEILNFLESLIKNEKSKDNKISSKKLRKSLLEAGKMLEEARKKGKL